MIVSIALFLVWLVAFIVIIIAMLVCYSIACIFIVMLLVVSVSIIIEHTSGLFSYIRICFSSTHAIATYILILSCSSTN